jgi:hypothetical protein
MAAKPMIQIREKLSSFQLHHSSVKDWSSSFGICFERALVIIVFIVDMRREPVIIFEFVIVFTRAGFLSITRRHFVFLCERYNPGFMFCVHPCEAKSIVCLMRQWNMPP